MSAFLLDVNVVLALVDQWHVFHDAAHRWARSENHAVWMTSPIVQNAVLRVATQSAYSERLGPPTAVRRTTQSFCAHPRHRFCPDDISLLDEGHLVGAAISPGQVTDVYLLALARRHGVRLATFDRRIPVDAVHDGAASLAVIAA